MKIIPLSEGSFTIDQTKEFVPFDLENDDLQQRTRGSLLVEIQPFVVITKKDIIILDCGLGFTNNQDVLQLHENLLANDIDPLTVTKVLLTHLHKDHSGGISKYDKVLNRYFLSFPNATYYVNREEMHAAITPGNPSYKPERMEILFHSDNIVLTEEKGLIDDYIFYEKSGAHSPFHQVFWIKEEGEIIFFGGDEAPQLQQMKSKFVAKYDFDGRKAMELRSKWWIEANENKWTILFYHDIKTPLMKF